MCARSVREKKNLFVQRESLYHLSIFRGKTCSLVFLHHFLSLSIDRSIDPVECPRSIRQCGPCVLNEILVWIETKFEEKKKRRDKINLNKQKENEYTQITSTHNGIQSKEKIENLCARLFFSFHIEIVLLSQLLITYIHIYIDILYTFKRIKSNQIQSIH